MSAVAGRANRPGSDRIGRQPASSARRGCGRGGPALPSKGQELKRAWSREVWAWSPEMGRWQPEHGRPKRPVSVAVSTDGVKPGEAFDYWRDIAYYHFDADRRVPGGTENFNASAYALITPGANTSGACSESALICAPATCAT